MGSLFIGKSYFDNHLDISLTFNEHVYSHDASLTLTDTNQDFSARCIGCRHYLSRC